MMLLTNEGITREIIQLKKELYTIKNERNKSTIDTNIINMVIKFQCMKLHKNLMRRQSQRKNRLFKRDHITSLQSDNVENIGEIYFSDDSSRTKQKKGQPKADSVYLLKYQKYITQGTPNDNFVNDDNKKSEIFKIVYKQKYEQSMS